MTTELTLITEEFDSDLEAIRLLVNAFKNSPPISAPKARIAAANSATLLLAATFEEFVREMARAYAKAVVTAAHSLEELLDVTSPPPEGGGFDLRLKSPKDLASDAGDSLDRLSHSARRPLP